MSERDLSKQIAAAKVLRAALEEYAPDQETVRDTIEGSTNLHEAVATVMANVMGDEILITGLDAMLKILGERKSRLEMRVERQRAAIEQAMLIGELRSLALPDATISLRETQAKVIVTDETKIPAQFFVAQPPKLDKAAVNAAIRSGQSIDGVILGNRTTSLSIRRA